MHSSVAGEPRTPGLCFAALLPFARWFNARFEEAMQRTETVTRGKRSYQRATTAPQVLVANEATVEALGKLGRRLAYLPTGGPRPADEALVRLGRHLRFLWDHRGVPGQQLIVAMTDLLSGHWASPLSPLERQSLAALDAWVEPPPETHGFDAAAGAEGCTCGPVPSGEDDKELHSLVGEFNRRRGGSTDPAVYRPLLGPLEAYYRPRLARVWELFWRCRAREAAYAEAASVARRWDGDRESYTRHCTWMASGGFRRTRQTPKQAVQTLRKLEDAARLLEAEQVCDDPLRMIPELLAGRAVRGRVLGIDREHRERGPKNMVRRPLLRLQSAEPCLMPQGKELWWSEHPRGAEWLVQAIDPRPEGCLVTLKLTTQSTSAAIPEAGAEACFSAHHTNPAPWLELPEETPWTHEAHEPAPALSQIEETEGRFTHDHD
jgi:hypothetical protein